MLLKDQNEKEKKVTHVRAKVDWYRIYPSANVYSHPVETFFGRFQQKCVVVKGTVKASGNRKDQVDIFYTFSLKNQNIECFS